MAKTKAKIPAIVRNWLKKNDYSPDEFHYGADDDPDWTKVSDELVSEDKYANISELVFRHERTGRFFRCLEESVPYGMDEYVEGLNERDPEIEEVFPVKVAVIKYMTESERRNHENESKEKTSDNS